MTSQTRRPIGDDTIPLNWTPEPSDPATCYDKIDSAGDSDYIIVQNAAGGGALFDFTPFAIPSNAEVTNLTIRVRAQDLSSDMMQLGYRIKVGGTTYDGVTDFAGSFEDKTWELTVNPKTSAAWTADQINGIGDNHLEYIGLYAVGGI